MPQIKFNQILDYSSEDLSKQLFANNLLKTQDFKSWKTKEWQTNCYVILETSEPQRVDNIEIGNDCSAFAEVLVANSSDPKCRYQVLLSTSSFMTPSDSHNLVNDKRIRHFPNTKLSPNSRNESWDRFKIVCTQPFNKTIPYGLAFIRFNSREEKDEEMDTNSTANTFGVFKLKAKDDEEVDTNSGSVFFKRNLQSSDESEKVSTRSSLASAVGFNTNSNKAFASHSSAAPKAKPKPKSPQNSPKQVTNNPIPTSSSSTSSPIQSPPKRQRKMKKDVPFNEIMSKVVFTLSGFVNPKRSELRDKALKMGAKYRPDWDHTCTHLICAFANTPKYNDVLAKKGRIVNEKWIEDCYRGRGCYDWRDYILGNYKPIDSEESDDEPQAPVVQTKPKRRYYLDDDEEGSEMKEVIGLGSNGNNGSHDSQNDTNDEIYDMETDNESTGAEHNTSTTESQSADNNTNPMDIFKGKYFHFFGQFDEKEKQLLSEYIVNHNGQISEELTPNVRFVLTYSQWNEDFEEACVSNDLLQIVKPKWIHKCIERSKLVPFQSFVVTFDCD